MGEESPPTSLRIEPDEVALYALRQSFNIFELACLVRGCSPEKVARRAHTDIADHRRAVPGEDGFAPVTAAEVLGLVDAMPGIILGATIGRTLADLKLAAAAPHMRIALDRSEARRLVERLGYSLPAELGAPETPGERAARRLERFRALGGALRKAGTGWQCAGLRGALAALVREEAAAGRPRADRKDVRADLIAATEANRGR